MKPLTDRQIHNCATRRRGNNVHQRQVRDRNMFPQLDFAYQFALLRQRRNAIMDGIKESDVAEKCLQQMREEVANKITGLLSQSDVRAAADKYDFEV